MAGVTGYRNIDLAKLPLADKPVKLDGVLAVPFEPHVRVQTEELLTAMSPLCSKSEDGTLEVLPTVTARASAGGLLNFMRSFEQSVLDVAKRDASKWWPRKNFEAAVIEHGFKSYMKGDDVFKLKVDTTAEPLVFDEQGSPVGPEVIKPGQRFWAVLEAHRVVIGKNEFGMVWRLHQIMFKPASTCLVKPQQQKRTADDDISDFS